MSASSRASKGHATSPWSNVWPSEPTRAAMVMVSAMRATRSPRTSARAAVLAFMAMISFGKLGCVKTAQAAGFEHPDVGTVAQGRGGAYAAEPDGGLALQY